MSSLQNFIVETPRLGLRQFGEGDLSLFQRLVGDPDLMRFIGPCLGPDEATEHLREAPLADYHKHGFGRWAVVLREHGGVIGFAGLKRLDDLGEVDLGFGFLPEYWGRGLATEAGAAALRYGRETLGLAQIVALVDPANARSIRVLTKLGFVFEKPIDYRFHPTALYRLAISDQAGI